ncbi:MULTISPECIES: PAS domain S-box protein [Filomicrobium]|uniref:Blue-light-activated histidine kinase n=1 Tax=Filomicrobium insigne TaxID=418854 RepID=A0A1H0ILK3_9HYPH|nr:MULTISPECIES: PAS domain S-box protein [Filomicrobium]MCV0368281.1 PAS domain S-box protein [Filomicrobium sp.]SDO32359.1 PAS domain S-box-containing protein [Filomicrobium insigne]
MLHPSSLPAVQKPGNLRTVIDGLDWSKTRVGARHGWPASLKAAVDLILPSPVPMVILWGEDGTMIYNDGYAAIARHRHPEVLGKTVLENFPEIADFHRYILDEVLSGASLSFHDKHFVIETHHSPRDFWFDLDFSPIADETGKPAGVLAVVVDTSPRVRAQRAHEESDARLRMLADNIAQFAWTADETGNVFWFNKRWYEYTGTGPDEVEGCGWHKLLHPDDVDHVVKTVSHCFASGEAWEDTFQLRGRDGQYRWFLSRAMPIHDDDGRIIQWFGTNTDITKEREAAATNAQLATIVSTSADAIMSLSPEGAILSWNPGAERLLGYGAEEIIGRSEAILYPNGSESEFRNLYLQLKQGKSVHRDSVRRHKDGTSVDVAVSAAPIQRPDGRIFGYSAVLQDITERKRADARMRLVTRELSHRTKNLLAVIVSMVRQTARMCTDVEAYQDELVQRLHAMSASHDLLVAEDWAGASLRELIDAVLKPFGGGFVKVVQVDAPNAYLNAHAIQHIALALHELATNAVKYGAMSVPTGRVHIGWYFEDDKDQRRLKFTWREHGGPPVKRPQRTGFGHVVVARVVGRALEADVSYEFAETGIIWSISIPTDFVITEGTIRRAG